MIKGVEAIYRRREDRGSRVWGGGAYILAAEFNESGV